MIREDLMTDHKKDFEEYETATIFKQFEAYGNNYGLVSMGYYLFTSILLYGNIYGLVTMGNYLWAGLMVTAHILLILLNGMGYIEWASPPHALIVFTSALLVESLRYYHY